MAYKLLGEMGGVVQAAHSGRGYVEGLTLSFDIPVNPPGNVIARVGLARLIGTVDGPPGATIGIAGFTFINIINGRDKKVDFGTEDQWDTALFHPRVKTITVGIHVHRAQMKGWFQIQKIDSF